MSNVVNFTGETIVDMPPERILEAAKKWGMDSCVVVGFMPDGKPMFGGSTSDAGDILIMLELAKKHILESLSV